jgi:hypothetical protein
MNTKISLIYASLKRVSNDTNTNALFCFHSSDINFFYRVKILKIKDVTCSVEFVDYGYTRTVSLRDIRELDSDLITQSLCMCGSIDDSFINNDQIIYFENFLKTICERDISLVTDCTEYNEKNKVWEFYYNNETLKSDFLKKCKLCFKEKSNCIFLPCKHTLFCLKCVQAVINGSQKCPKCNVNIESFNQFFI